MTITEATHALARRVTSRRPAEQATVTESARPVDRVRASDHVRPAERTSIRLADAMLRVEPSWVEAVAVVQAVCAQLAPGCAAPTLDVLVIEGNGTVSFPETAAADDHAAVRGAGHLLNAVLRTAGCPMPVWDATERALRAPDAYGSARTFGAMLTAVSAADGARELQQYFQVAVMPHVSSARASLAGFGGSGSAPAR